MILLCLLLLVLLTVLRNLSCKLVGPGPIVEIFINPRVLAEEIQSCFYDLLPVTVTLVLRTLKFFADFVHFVLECFPPLARCVFAACRLA